MFVQIQTADGQLFRSDEVVLEDVGATAFQQAVENLTTVLENLGVADGLWLEINGQTRYFNPRHIVWSEIV